MSTTLNYLLSGGRLRRAVAVNLHGSVWAYRNLGRRANSQEFRLLDMIDLKGRVAIDVGAHAGDWTTVLARRVGPGGIVLAYEALPHYGKALKRCLWLLRKKNVEVRAVAVGDSEGTIALRWRSESNELLTGRTHVEPNANAAAGVVSVPMVTLDRDLQRYGIQHSRVGFIKIDVEGAELKVLLGAARLLTNSRPVVYLEAEPKWLSRMGNSVQQLFEAMGSWGYHPYLFTSAGPVQTDVESYLAQYDNGREFNNVLFLPVAG